jgi:16S rRNA (guanine966-N2)-methyltransferase
MSALAPSLPGARVLDLFSGSGALGLECLSRGAAEVVFVERARGALRTLGENVALLGCGARAQIVQGDALRYVRGLPAGAFDLALADPPYGQGMAAELLERFASTPFAHELWVEHRTSDPLPALPGIRQRRYGDTVLTTVTSTPESR